MKQTKANTGFSASFARLLIDYAESQGIDKGSVAMGLGLALNAPDGPQRVPSVRVASTLKLLSKLCADEHVGLRAAQMIRPAHLGSLGGALASCVAGADALALFEGLQSLTCNDVHIQTTFESGQIRTHWQPQVEMPEDPDFWVFFVSLRLSFARWVVGRELIPLGLELPCRPPDNPQPFLEFARGPVKFDAPVCREILPIEWLQVLNPNGDLAMFELFAAMARQQLEAAADDGPEVIGKVKQSVARLLKAGLVPTLQEVCALPGLGLTARQIQRRLTKDKLSFKELTETVRKEQVLTDLRQTNLPLTEVAKRAAYMEPSSFYRAVRRWTGSTPTEVRAANQTLT